MKKLLLITILLTAFISCKKESELNPTPDKVAMTTIDVTFKDGTSQYVKVPTDRVMDLTLNYGRLQTNSYPHFTYAEDVKVFKIP